MNMKRVLGRLFLFLICCGLVGCGREPLPDPAFNVPALIGKDIQGVEQTLGTPSEYSVPEKVMTDPSLAKEWDKTWSKAGQELLVTYRLSDGKIVDFFIPTDHPKGSTSDQERLLALGNLKRDDPRYRVEFVVAMGHLKYYTGVKVVPN